VITKTTDSALTGTNLRLILHNMEIANVVVAGIFTDQCVSSTVRSLADESFNVVVVEGPAPPRLRSRTAMSSRSST
jgi:biuret amidohydrolase